MSFNTTVNSLRDLISLLRKYLSYSIEYVHLTIIEKMTWLVGVAIEFTLIFIMALFALAFLGFTTAALFKECLPEYLAYLCTAGVFVVLILTVHLLRVRLIYNPIARKLSSKLMQEPHPKNNDYENIED